MDHQNQSSTENDVRPKVIPLNNLLVCNATQRGFRCYREGASQSIYFLVRIIEMLNDKRIEISDLIRELEINLKVYQASQISEIEKYNFAKHFYFDAETVVSFKPDSVTQMYYNITNPFSSENNNGNKGKCVIISHCCTDADKIYWDVDVDQLEAITIFFTKKQYDIHYLIDRTADELLKEFRDIVNNDCIGEAIFIFFISLGFRDNGIEYLEFNNDSYMTKQNIIQFWGSEMNDIPKFIFFITNRCEATRNYSPFSDRNCTKRPLNNSFRAFVRENSRNTETNQSRFSQILCSKISVFKDTDFVNVFSQAERFFSNNSNLSICSFTTGLHRKVFLNVSSKFDALNNSYALKNKGKGVCLIVNTLKYSTYRDLYSSIIDTKIYFDTFNSLCYRMRLQLNTNNFDVALDDAFRDIDVEEIDVVVVVLLCETLYSDFYECKIKMKYGFVSLDESINKCCRLSNIPTIVLAICRDSADYSNYERMSKACLDLKASSIKKESIEQWITGHSKTGGAGIMDNDANIDVWLQFVFHKLNLLHIAIEKTEMLLNQLSTAAGDQCFLHMIKHTLSL